MRWLVESSTKFRLLVVAVATALFAFGVVELSKTPVDVLPEFTPTYVEVQTEAPGLSAPEVEQLLTVPLEGDLLNGVAGIDVIRSESVPGLSSIVLVFERGTDLLDARQLVQERLTQAHALPNVSKPPVMLQPLSSSSRVLVVGLASRELSAIDLGVLARWTVKPRLLGVPGVANVAIWGQRDHQLQVQVDPVRLQEQNVSLAQVVSTAGNAQLVSPLSFLEASTPGSSGFLDTPNQRLQLRHVLPIADPAGLARVPVEGAEGLLLGDVAEVVVDNQPLIGDAVVNGGPGLLLVVEKLPGANTLEVTRDVEDALDALRPAMSGVEIDSPAFRPATYIETAIDNLTVTLAVGLGLVTLAVLAFFLNWRAAAIVAAAIPLPLVVAALVMSLGGQTINLLVMAGLVLAVAIVVDEAVTGVEATLRGLEHPPGKPRPAVATLVRDASLSVRGPLAYATAIIVLTALPVLALQGRPGEFFRPLALSYVLAVIAAMVVALTVTPALSALLLRRAPHDGAASRLDRWLARAYAAPLRTVVRRPAIALVSAAVVALAGLAVLPQLGFSLLPAFKESEVLIQLGAVPGTSRPEMNRITARLGNELQSVPGVENVGAHVGRAVLGDEIVDVSSSELWLSIDPDADYDPTLASIHEVVDGYPGLERRVLTYSADRLEQIGALDDGETGSRAGVAGSLEVLTGAGDPIGVRIYGKDLGVLRERAEEVRQALAGVEGVVDARVEPQPEQVSLEIETDLEAAARYGVKPGDVRRAAATLVHGIEVGSLFEEQKVFEVVVVGAPHVRHSLTGIGELPIDAPSGRVRLGDVAEVRLAPTPTAIRREAASRRIDVTAGVSGRNVSAVVEDIERALVQVEFPLEYHAELLGLPEERSSAQDRLLVLGIAAAIAIFLVLQAAVRSWRLAAALFVSLPVGLAGGAIAAAIVGSTISLGSLIGFFALYGLAARQTILLVRRSQELRSETSGSQPEPILRGAGERLRPALVSSVATALGFVPLLVTGAIPGQEIAQPLAVVVVGGLFSTTAFSLLVVPALCARLGLGAVGEPAAPPQPRPKVGVMRTGGR